MAQLFQRRRRIALEGNFIEVQHLSPVGKAQHIADLLFGDFSGPVGKGLIQKAETIAHGPFGGAGDHGQGLVLYGAIFLLCNFAKMRGKLFYGNPPQIEPLTAAEDRNRDFADFSGGKDKLHMLRRLFQRFEQGVKGIA